MIHKPSSWVILINVVLVLSVFTYLVLHKEQLLKTGEQAFIALAPVDPRSLMQGDYMILNYAIPSAINKLAKEQRDGLFTYTLDENKVLQITGIYNEEKALQAGEKLIQFRYRSRNVQLAANSFLFQEGKAELFEQAKFGEVRIDTNGNAMLVGLRDEKHQLLGLSSGLN